MNLPPLTTGRILRRYKRFLADVELDDGQVVVAHCPNTGSMKTCWAPGVPAQISHSDNPKRKLPWTLERLDMGAGWIGVNTHLVNNVIAKGAAAKMLPGLERTAVVKKEVRPPLESGSRSRLDLLLEGEGQVSVYVEVKNVTLLDDDLVRFPDAVSERARKHLGVLKELVNSGYRAVILFAVNRPEGKAFAPADDIDPEYAKALKDAVAGGVEAMAVRLVHGSDSTSVGAPMPIRF